MHPVDAAHLRAMELVGLAMLKRREGFDAEAAGLLAEAFRHEREAAHGIASEIAAEPSRSVLHRSAAALALQCDEVQEAERLVCAGLAGSPPAEIARELRLLYDEAKFRRVWAERGVELSSNEVELRLDGPAVGAGVTPAEGLIERVQAAKQLVMRTAERLWQFPFRERGRPKRGVAQELEMFMRPAPAGSFGVTLQIGATSLQLPLEGASTVDEIVSDVLGRLESFADGDDESLRDHITDEAYYRNFVALAQQLGPDGKNVELVALSSQTAGVQRTVALRRRGPGDSSVARRATGKRQGWVVITGELVSAEKSDSLDRQGSIHLVDASGGRHAITVLKGMSDVVKTYWDDTVAISGPKKKGRVYLERIERADDDTSG